MVLIRKPVAKPGSTVAGLKATPPQSKVNGKAATKPAATEERATKSVTTRMPPATLDMLDGLVASYESDRTEVVKRAIRLMNACLSGHNTVVIITDAAGKSKELNLVIDGVPT